MTAVLSLARPDIVKRSAYNAASPERDLIRLHANESPWSLENKSAIDKPPTDDLRELNRYPDPKPMELVTRMSNYYGVSNEQVLPVRGSDDGIDLLIRTFCEAGKDTISISSPAFSMYGSFAGIQGAGVVDIPLREDDYFSLDIDALCSVAPESKLVFVCTPNNPTGHSVSTKEIETLCTRLKGRSVVVVDEAYIEFSPYSSASVLMAGFDNLVILRTLSKAFGAAGIRCGAVLACEPVIELLRSVATPYALPTPTIELAIDVLNDDALQTVGKRTAYLSEHCRMLHDALSSHPLVLKAYPSDTNFLLAKFENPSQVHDALREGGVLVRNFASAAGTAGCLRISTGFEDENRRVLQILDRVSQSVQTNRATL